MTKTLAATAVMGMTAALVSVPAQADTFEGPYVGVSAGYDRAEISDATIDADVSKDALSLGGYAGYNYKITDRIVIGAEAGINASVDNTIAARSDGAALTIDPLYDFDLSARFGYLATDKALFYVRGGYTNDRVRTTLSTANGLVRETDNLDGWQVGGGVEYALTNRISARAEYRYSDLGQDGGQFDRHQGLIGISYNF